MHLKKGWVFFVPLVTLLSPLGLEAKVNLSNMNLLENVETQSTPDELIIKSGEMVLLVGPEDAQFQSTDSIFAAFNEENYQSGEYCEWNNEILLNAPTHFECDGLNFGSDKTCGGCTPCDCSSEVNFLFSVNTLGPISFLPNVDE